MMTSWKVHLAGFFLVGALVVGIQAGGAMWARRRCDSDWNERRAHTIPLSQESSFTVPGAEPLQTHVHDTPLIFGLGAPLRVRWTTFVRAKHTYVAAVHVAATRPVAAKSAVDFGTVDVMLDAAGNDMDVVPMATTWINRCGMLVHDYFSIAADGRVVYQGTYID